ncbi:MAG TPA: DUF89 family protein [Candidatus Hydrogenedentes bacterium]|nr:DUF89 family protein [Candidatus Hydrogenedentota bacterium]
MRTYFDCIPCFVRQALDSVRRVTDDKAVQEQVLRETLGAIREMDYRASPPAMGREIHRCIRKRLGARDPYRAMKDQSNQRALELYPALKSKVARSTNPLETAVRLAIAGNIIDIAVKGDVGRVDVDEAIEHALTAPFDVDIDGFAEAVSAADTILYLTDNAGEIVFDRLLIEALPLNRVTIAVRGAPVINDATIEDARAAGITGLVDVIDNGSDVPGTILDTCSPAFRRQFEEADLAISKGQGNYETLSDERKNLFFLLKVKCPVIARDIGFDVGSLVLYRSDHVVADTKKGGRFARI